MKHPWQPIIGLEIHVELKTKSKMFCPCSAVHFNQLPNIHTCPVCLGMPGSLPVPNEKAIEWTILAGLALGGRIPEFSKFDRKSYFYPDLPKGYQISQYDTPFAMGGFLVIAGKKIRIRRVHLEEETAKLFHSAVGEQRATLIDYNRCGVPLMEIVTEPDIASPQEAKDFLKKLQLIIRYLDISDCDMEKGSMRLEPNISVQKAGVKDLPGYKVEIKNLNSFRFVEKAITYEIERQITVLEKGKTPVQETRGWDERKQITYTQRVKEEANDYRYFPEPDIPPIRWQAEKIESLRRLLPELPDAKKQRFIKDYRLIEGAAGFLVCERRLSEFFEEAVRAGAVVKISPKEIANILINKKVGIDRMLPAQLIKVLREKREKRVMGDTSLEAIVEKVVAENKEAIADFKRGKANALMFLVGQVQKESRGKSDPAKAREIVLKKLGVN